MPEPDLHRSPQTPDSRPSPSPQADLSLSDRGLATRDGKVLKTRNLLEMQRTIRKAVTCELFLRQRSAYDEMVGHSYQAADNVMELPLGREPLPEWLN